MGGEGGEAVTETTEADRLRTAGVIVFPVRVYREDGDATVTLVGADVSSFVVGPSLHVGDRLVTVHMRNGRTHMTEADVDRIAGELREALIAQASR